MRHIGIKVLHSDKCHVNKLFLYSINIIHEEKIVPMPIFFLTEIYRRTCKLPCVLQMTFGIFHTL